MRRSPTLVLAIVIAAAVVLAGCSSDSDDSDATDTTEANVTTTTAAPSTTPIAVFGAEDNRLWAYEPDAPFEKQKVIASQADDPVDGLDINAQICPFELDGEQAFIAGEDTDQSKGDLQGWGIFLLSGSNVGDFSAEQVAKLVPTYQASNDNAENYGCGVLSDGRIVTTDVGNQSSGQGDGQLIIWFPPFDSEQVSYCKLDIGLTTAQAIAVDDDDTVYVATAFPTTAGVYRYRSPFPTSADATGGCDTTDGTGAPMASAVTKDTFIAPGEHGMVTPSGLSFGPDGHLYVSSVITGTINEYDASGAFVRTILAPPAGETAGPTPISTGTPLGIAMAPDGSALYYADIGIVGTGIADFGPKDGLGTVRKIAFVDGAPQAPETMAEGYAFPDAVAVFTG
jgi:sugar lactone lactonase YvrE